MSTTFLLTCPKCTAKNRFPGGKRVRCGKCKHEFTPAELVKARPDVPARTFALDMEDDGPPQYYCRDEDECGWEGTKDELEDGKCPECGKRVKKEDA